VAGLVSSARRFMAGKKMQNFVKIPVSVMAVWPELRPSTKAVLVALASFIGSTGACWPGRDQVMQRAGLSNKNYFADALKELEEKNVMHISRRFRNSSVYRWSEGTTKEDVSQSDTYRKVIHTTNVPVKVPQSDTQTRFRELEEEENTFSEDTKSPATSTDTEKAFSFFEWKQKNSDCPFGQSKTSRQED
jgi:hypothetical protein